MWCDTIDLLKRMGKDIRCPKYVCPADLKAEHDKLVEQRNRKEERERLALRRKEAAQYEKGYLSQKGKFFGILITDGTLNVRVLESGRGYADAPLCICQRLLPQGELADIVGYHREQTH